MPKDSGFWIGFFAAVLLTGTFLVGAWSLAEDYAAQMTTLFVGALIASMILLTLAFILKDRMLKFILGSAQSSLSDVLNSLVDAGDAAISGEKDRAKAEIKAAMTAMLAWYSWVNFYRWVLATGVAILLAFAAFTGSVLLFEQNAKLQAQTDILQIQTNQIGNQNRLLANQNELFGLSLVRDIRERLKNDKKKDYLSVYLHPAQSFTFENGTIKYRKKFTITDTPNQSTLEALLKQIIVTGDQDKMVSSQIVSALQSLLYDRDSSVVLSALSILDRVGQVPEGTKISLSEISILDLKLSSPIQLSLDKSLVSRLNCPNCSVEIFGSVILESQFKQLTAAYHSVVLENTGLRAGSRNNDDDPTAVNKINVPSSATSRFGNVIANLGLFEFQGDITSIKQDTIELHTGFGTFHHIGTGYLDRDGLESFTDNNPFFQYEEASSN